ncbi:acyl-CoA dehydrogenase [Pseudomonas sp. H9]|uniref:acyl-CoA dehydrogenase n=1 Tax=Pseudomonas sp. H9 TaxID=483968 RepID=UPI0010577519|nr:acyl-CoA dehydrogenase [Pseudomonas sp. H9]TDF80742.1 acyl-CoA dehydrogenase [Pseudomonas sp. H9]
MNCLETLGADSATPSELHTLIAESVERLFAREISASALADFDRDGCIEALWQRVVDIGLPHALVPEQAGGSGASLRDASAILRAIGYWQAPLPLGETLLATALLTRAGLDIPEGSVSLIQAGRLGDVQLDLQGLSVNGRAEQVPWSRACPWAVIADDQHIALVDLRHSSVERSAACNVANEQRDTLCFQRTPLLASAALPLPGVGEPVWLLGALLRACTLVGALESALDKAVGYANERVQFGKPIGRQQALQQLLAQMAGALAMARMATQIALGSASDFLDGQLATPQRLLFDIAAAKVCASEAATLGCSVAHQVHGSIGFTHEHSLHHVTRRLWSWREEFGSDAQWAQQLGSAAIESGALGFWDGLVERDLWRTRRALA